MDDRLGENELATHGSMLMWLCSRRFRTIILFFRHDGKHYLVGRLYKVHEAA